MTRFTAEQMMNDALISDAAAAVRPDREAADVIARAAWSVLTEPGDGVAGALIAAFGAAGGLEAAWGARAQSPEAAELSGEALATARARWRPRAHPNLVLDALRSCAEVGATMLLPGDSSWPVAVDDLGPHAPVALWARGDLRALQARAVALVGARAATPYGTHIAAELAGDLAHSGEVIVSGGAYGIDGAAHRAALGVGGMTVAFMAGGVDRAYPAGHHRLFEEIRSSGTVVAEVPCGAAPTRWRFLARNRIISAAGAATVVVEAGWRSGSLNTAGHASALGRPLGAVPGPVTSATLAGCHRLLREFDAVCVTNAEEVRELCGSAVAEPPPLERSSPVRTRLLDALSSRTPHEVSELARRSGLSLGQVRSELGLLEIDGRATRSGGRWRKVS